MGKNKKLITREVANDLDISHFSLFGIDNRSAQNAYFSEEYFDIGLSTLGAILSRRG